MVRFHLLLATILPFSVPLPASAQELELAPKVLYELKGDTAFNKQFGIGVWTLQDVNGDTHDDLLVTDRKTIANHPTVQGGWVYSGLDGRLLYPLDEDPPEGSILASTGTNFAQLGDIDGDRIADFIVGDNIVDDRTGRAVLFSGKTGSIIRAHQGTGTETDFGVGTYALGDLDQDGLIDYGIESSRAITIYSGRSGDQLACMEGGSFRLLEIDDLNEDGTPDLAVVVNDTNIIQFVSGTVRGTFSARSLPESLLLGRYFHDENDGDRFAASDPAHTVQNVSDLDGDGFHEILVRRSPNSFNTLVLVAISPKKAEKIWTADFGINDLNFDYESVGEIGDLNGDGVTEIVTSLAIRPLEYFLVVISGLNGRFLYTQQFPSNPRDLTVMSDLDGDGIREVAVGERTWKGGTGEVIIYSFGPASQVLDPYRPSNPQLTIHATLETVTIAWTAAMTDPQPEWSTDLQTWQPVFEGTAAESGRFVLPGTEAQPQRYFRLQYQQ